MNRSDLSAIPHLALGALIAMMLAACAVGPNYKTPAAPKTSGYLPAGERITETSASPTPGGEAQHYADAKDIPGQWWTLFQSPDLNALVERGLARNPNLQSAQAALRQAHETVAAARGSYFPSVTGNASATRQKSSAAAFGIPGQSSFIYTLDSASLNVSYTLDAFGGVRRQVEALGAQAEYEQFALEASYLSISSNIVTAAITEASLRAQIASTEQIVDAQRKQLDITNRRFTAGGSSKADVLQQEATLQTTLATLPGLRRQLTQQRNLLATYVGELPADFQSAAFELDALTLPQELPLSLPSKLVEQRPDVREYAALLHESTAQIGVATANMLPQITLTGSVGGQAGSFSDVFSSSAGVWSLAASLAQPLFKGGQLLHQRRAAVAAAEQAEANYRATVITAFQNVADTLAALQADADALTAQAAAEQAAAGSLNLVQAQYKSGGASYLQVLTAEQTYQNAAVALVRARAQRYTDTAALFQALGGGWWNRSDVARPM
jgi:NodT family efflux transporter outer membrane factor (OMF) lipoprotein